MKKGLVFRYRPFCLSGCAKCNHCSTSRPFLPRSHRPQSKLRVLIPDLPSKPASRSELSTNSHCLEIESGATYKLVINSKSRLETTGIPMASSQYGHRSCQAESLSQFRQLRLEKGVRSCPNYLPSIRYRSPWARFS